MAVGQGVDWGVVSLLEQADAPNVTERRHATPAIREGLILSPPFSPQGGGALGVTVVSSRRVAAEPDITPAASPRQWDGSASFVGHFEAYLLGDALGE